MEGNGQSRCRCRHCKISDRIRDLKPIPVKSRVAVISHINHVEDIRDYPIGEAEMRPHVGVAGWRGKIDDVVRGVLRQSHPGCGCFSALGIYNNIQVIHLLTSLEQKSCSVMYIFKIHQTKSLA